MNSNTIGLNQINYPPPNSISSPSFTSPTASNSENLEETDSQMIPNLLLEYVKQKNPKDFRSTLSSNFNHLSKNSIENIFLYILSIYISGNIYASRFLSILIPFGVNPNITLNQINYIIEGKDPKEEYNQTESILMIFCSKSNGSIISNLCESKIKLDVNYLDINKRNALFYLRGGNDDKKIIELLVKKGINVNAIDIDGNTPLHNAILNVGKIQLISNLIEIGNSNFMIKNNQNYNCLELLTHKFISRKNKSDNKNVVSDYIEIKEMIEIIKEKLSIKTLKNSKILNNMTVADNIINIDFKNNSNKLIQLPTFTVNENIKELNENNNEINNEDNIFLLLKKNPSLLIDTQFNDGQTKTSTCHKIEYYNKINENKKYFINLLKTSNNFLKEKSISIKEEIELKKKKLEEQRIYLNSIKQNINLIDENHKNELIKKNSEILEVKKKIEMIKNNIINKEKNIVDIKPKLNILYKYESLINPNKINYEYIFNQLQIDLLDYMQYVHNKNAILKNTVSKVKQLLEESVQNCLGKNYEVKIYGSRETGLCLPWSDIDAVISFSENKYMDPLNILYIYLLNNFSFVNIKYIENTQIPLIKIITTNEFYNISLDISLELPEHHGAECVSYIKEKIKEYEVLTPLTLALKTIFQKGKLNDPYIGGLSSYGIILIIINFLKIKQKEGKDISLKNLGKLFYELLVFYGKQYDINSPIDVNGKDENDIIPLTNNTNGLIIVDPLNKYNNVAKNVRQFMNIRFALNIAIASIYESCECGCHYQYEGLCIKEEGCNHNLLNNIFNSVKRN